MTVPELVKHLQAATGLYASIADELLLRATSTSDGYRRYLERALGFERGLESALANAPFAEWSSDARAKSPLIAADLCALGASVESVLALPTCDVAVSIRDSVDAIGWLFVSERVSFAHGLAYHQLDPATRAATSYFNALLVRTGWVGVLHALEKLAADPRAIEQVIASAITAFRAQRAWFAEVRSKRTTGAIGALDPPDIALREKLAHGVKG